ncbi:putative metalloendopeptidase [Corynebacterium kutscheri]|uniref:Endopeptidase n=1 Tax=Corynebacterium kutscheri TaxID=35755 RepID=A0A0F6QY03_9CORY|nr:M13-type metalloendopeptidase [Corynebacterium kutscheri]AKE40307.1 putative metalloendopeptidase [Corynebacterium kutscheri]VEH05470.1 endopeptidase [Corynebacterium kutscheri]VEH10700.1 endopeptidase [Corynebacterium kutscheri]
MTIALTDLYRFVNGPWLDSHVIPADRGIDGTFHTLRDDAEEHVHTLVQDNPDSLAGKLYASFMDIDGIEQAGTSVLDTDFALIDAASTLEEFYTGLGQLNRTGISGFLGFWVAKDAGDTPNAVAYVTQDGLGLPDEAYYRDESKAELLAAYQAHIARMLEFLSPQQLGISPSEAAEKIVAVEKAIAQHHVDVVEARDAKKSYNPTQFADLPAATATFLRAAQVPESLIIVRNPTFVAGIEEVFANTSLADLQLWAKWLVLNERAGMLSPEISLANFEFYGTALSGATEQRDRWKRALGVAESFVGDEIGQLYVAKYFSPEAKTDMLSLVDYLLAAYNERVRQLPWMTDTTKEKALEKLALFSSKIGYPDKWRSYEGLDFSATGDQLIANARRGNEFIHDYELAKIGKPADSSEWFATPQTVNAFYNPVNNDITFPAAILRPPFYEHGIDAAENFGAIGAVIGHEIGHGLDDQGSQYDGNGNLQSWWSEQDQHTFEELTGKLVNQFEGLIPTALADTDIETTGVNGRFTLGENIGDLGGLGIAVVAYRNYLADRGLTFETSPVLPFSVDNADPELEKHEYNGLQRLFLSWARVWRTKARPELAAQYLAIDPHSPAEFRCNVIAGNIAELYEAFDIAEGSPLWIDEDKRVTIW